jgi:ATP adenylyltransferase
MERIWAPWRMEYIESTKDPRNNSCFLCMAARNPEGDEGPLVLARKGKAFMVMNKYPYANGHVMVVPMRHVGRIDALADDELLDMMGLVRVISSVLMETLNADGLNIGVNMGKAAGAGLEEHLHIHVVPRWFGDTNFMPVIGETKVISEHLLATYRKLREKLCERLR